MANVLRSQEPIELCIERGIVRAQLNRRRQHHEALSLHELLEPPARTGLLTARDMVEQIVRNVIAVGAIAGHRDASAETDLLLALSGFAPRLTE